ncbi:MAG: hypothetical protein ACREVX_12240 [Clostridium sp.]|uniref:hypothetical protein n=1 Tax=Clostridium sp. TaxID=1506 RepID=UPI003D6CD2DB
MKKPSIFSKNYDKEIKKRKKIIILLIIMPIVGLGIFLITDFNSLLDKGISMKNGINNILLNKSDDTKEEIQVKKEEQVKAAQVKKEQEEVAQKQASAEKTEPAKEEDTTKNEIFVATLSDGQKINIEYSKTGTEKNIVGVSNAKEISYDISPNKKAIVVQNMKNQDMLYVNVNETTKDITKKVYVSSKKVPFTKQEKMIKTPDYVWSITPKFIDEDNIAYVSELPWMNEKKLQYIWKVNLKNNKHVQVNRSSGKKIIFQNIESKGLAANIDGNVVYITPLGKIIK